MNYDWCDPRCPNPCWCQETIEKKMREDKEKERWENQDHQCSGSGYSHKPHGKCRGYSTDRT